MEKTKITLEDCGQDFTTLITNNIGMVIDAKPFQASMWRGAMIPIHDASLFRVGEPLPIHHPPHIKYGFLKYKIIGIEQINDNYNE